MRNYWTLVMVTMLLWGTSGPANAQRASDIQGIWLREDKKNYKVQIYACGDSYCGKIVWLKEPNDKEGKPRVDRNNTDPNLQNQPLLGLEILRGFKFDGKNWKGGHIYSFNRGKEYDAQIKLKEDVLYLTISILFLSKTYTWIKSD